jgi:RNA recognition motif-containing protein
MIKLFVVGFPKEMGEIELNELFSNHGLVSTITVVRDMQTGVSKGYAFVNMMDQPGADRAIQALNGFNLNGRMLNVRIAENKSSTSENQIPPNKRPERFDGLQRNKSDTFKPRRRRRN